MQRELAKGTCPVTVFFVVTETVPIDLLYIHNNGKTNTIEEWSSARLIFILGNGIKWLKNH